MSSVPKCSIDEYNGHLVLAMPLSSGGTIKLGRRKIQAVLENFSEATRFVETVQAARAQSGAEVPAPKPAPKPRKPRKPKAAKVSAQQVATMMGLAV
jgi:hypothetical protein